MVMLKTITVCALLCSLLGCVSSGGSAKPKVDKQKALEANINLGMSYLQQGDRDRALRSFDKARTLDSKSAEAMQGLAMVHQLNGERKLAESSFKKALKLRSDFSKASIELSYARFLFEDERYSEAVGYLEKSSADFTYPSRGAALYLLGLCALKLDDRTRAHGVFEHAINLNRRNGGAAIELAAMAFEDRNYAESKKYLDMFSESSRQTARSLWLGIRIERIFGNRDKEASHALALKNLHPYSKEYLEYKRLLKQN